MNLHSHLSTCLTTWVFVASATARGCTPSAPSGRAVTLSALGPWDPEFLILNTVIGRLTYWRKSRSSLRIVIFLWSFSLLCIFFFILSEIWTLFSYLSFNRWPIFSRNMVFQHVFTAQEPEEQLRDNGSLRTSTWRQPATNKLSETSFMNCFTQQQKHHPPSHLTFWIYFLL